MPKNSPVSSRKKKPARKKETPMMEQFWRAKKEEPDALLFFRMGDFYELFHEDAQIASRELGITLTARSKGEDAIAMAGIPVKSAETYLMRLVRKGFRVAICEQLTDPRHTKGIVDRGIVRVVTPGTLTEENALDANRSNFLACVFARKDGSAALAWVDLSTGRLQACEVPREKLADEVARVAPAELLWPPDIREHVEEQAVEIDALLGACVAERDPWHFERGACERLLLEHFGVGTLEGFGLDAESPIVSAAGALMQYLQETQKSACGHVLRIEVVDTRQFLVLDRATRSCLELTRTQREGRREGTLLEALDATRTPMGGRLLHEWLLAPLTNVDAILERQRAVAEVVENPLLRDSLREKLGEVLDMERLVAKVSTGRANGRDLVALAQSTGALPPLRALLDDAYSSRLGELFHAIDPLDDVTQRIQGTLVEAPPLTLRDGGLIAGGVSAELDDLRQTAGDGKNAMARFQKKEIERTGIGALKIGFNSVFGYYIEVPRGQVERVPGDYIRKQTIKTAERYITPELKEFETKVLKAEELSKDLEAELFDALRAEVAAEMRRILDSAAAVAQLDVLCGLGQVAAENRYVAPKIDGGDAIQIQDGRHPVIERATDDAFVPNDSHLNRSKRMVAILTGPNMAGKSTFIRQTALITLMAQMGSFVPAAEAKVGVVDRIFTRLGSADDIGRGASTFMVEMIEIANILNNATKRSLVILDEVGRGTSTYDGLALAWAIVEHLHEKIGARTLFATHYHQLTDLANQLDKVCNLNVAVREWNDEIIFLHKIVEGGTDRSYGIHVARLAGVPRPLLDRAKEILHELEEEGETRTPTSVAPAPAASAPHQPSLFDKGPSPVERELQKLDPNAITPLEALQKLAELKGLL